jgi:hypothetical protein
MKERVSLVSIHQRHPARTLSGSKDEIERQRGHLTWGRYHQRNVYVAEIYATIRVGGLLGGKNAAPKLAGNIPGSVGRGPPSWNSKEVFMLSYWDNSVYCSPRAGCSVRRGDRQGHGESGLAQGEVVRVRLGLTRKRRQRSEWSFRGHLILFIGYARLVVSFLL